MKRIFKKIVPILLSMFIAIGVVFSSYDTAKATGMEEYLYVTYWDLMNTLYSMCGYDMTVDENVVKNHSVTGKQVWNNFTTFVENAAKIHWKAFSEAGSAAMKELKNLVNTATEKGISISQDLYDMLKDVFGYQVEYSNYVNQFDCSSAKSVDNFISSLTGGGFLDSGRVQQIVSGTALLNISYSDGMYNVFILQKGDLADDYRYYNGITSYKYLFVFKNGSDRSAFYGVFGSIVSNGGTRLDTSCSGVSLDYSWIVKNGAFTGTDTIGAQVSAGACPKEVPDVKPWIKSPDIPDEYRIVKPNESPGQKPDPDKNPDFIPGIIPFKPKTPQKPDGTEETETTEKPDKDKDKKKKPAVNPIINPQTGNVIDPETGLDIDPDTGKLIDPDTGKLIDPADGGGGGGSNGLSTIDKLGKYGDITKLFPFCIPFDIVNLIKGMSAKKAPPVFHFEYHFDSINYTFKVDVDLSDYDKYIRLFRYGMQIFYVLALMFLTIKISKLFI